MSSEPLPKTRRRLELHRRGLAASAKIYITEFSDGRIERETLAFDNFDETCQWQSIFKSEVPKETFENYVTQVLEFDLAILKDPVENVWVSANSFDMIVVNAGPDLPGKFCMVHPTAQSFIPWYETQLLAIFLVIIYLTH